MSRKARSVERYHDRVAPLYDSIYGNDPYWDFYRAVTWEHLRRFIPSDLGPPVLDAGCGTGHFGLRLAKSGYRVVFADISAAMLDQVGRAVEELGVGAKTELLKADICDLKALPDSEFSLVIAEGDPLSFCADAESALREFQRILRPGGALVASVDHSAGAMEHFLAASEGARTLEHFLKTGRTEWLARSRTERFPVKMFSSGELEHLVTRAGLVPESLIGKTVLPLRKYPQALGDRTAIREWVKLEGQLHARRDLWGRAAHLEIAARKSS